MEPDRSKITLPVAVSEFPESASFWIGENGSIYKNYRGGRPFMLPEE